MQSKNEIYFLAHYYLKHTSRQILRYSFKVTDPFFLPILIIIIIFFFFGEKVSSGIWETCPKILGGYVYQNPHPPKWG